MAKKSNLIGEGRTKLQPKLRMIANGSEEVNAVRAEQCAAIRVTSQVLLNKVPRRRDAGDVAYTGRDLKRIPPRGSLAKIAPDIEASVFVQLNDTAIGSGPVKGEVARKGNIVSARVALTNLPQLTKDPRVAFVEIGEALKHPRPAITAGNVSPPTLATRRLGKESQHHYGENVLVGIIDVQGFDFTHPDFLDSKGRTRFAAIWDQGGDARPSPGPAKGQFGYGAEFKREHLIAAMKAAPSLGVPAYDIERQSQMDAGSHGTHVASIAAGNRGICRRSPIAGVLISLSESDDDKRRSFYDSTRIADAVDYLVALAGRMQKAVSINISLGTNGHAHDGTGAIGRWIDSVMSTPGRAVTVAAGNSGQEKGESPDDIGWVMGRVHTSGRVPATGLAVDVEWVVAGNGLVDISENELELWFGSQDRFAIEVFTPQGQRIGPVEPREFIENRRLDDGSFISVYNELYHPANGANYISVYLSPNLRSEPVIGVPAGTWVVRVHGRQVRDGRFDGWIERDDPRPVGQLGPKQVWAFPSFFSERSMVDNSTVSSLGCGHRVLAVANLHEAKNLINISSSQGPTRDGRYKPDVAAPGTDIVAAKGFSSDDDPWIGMTGTSMASPYVAGVAGLMLAIEPKLTAAQIEGIVRSTARPLPGGAFSWANDAGFGVIDPEKALEQAALASVRQDRTENGTKSRSTSRTKE
jgi:subtilisin family serine protease